MPSNLDVSDGFLKGGAGGQGASKYVNPFFGIPLQFLPLNMDGMLWWANHFLFRFDFYKSSLQRVANYFITSLSVDCDDEESVEEYKNVFDKLNWKETLSECGLNLLAYGNAFVTVNQGFHRFLICPHCSKVSLIDRIHDYTFEKGQYNYRCPRCNFKGVHIIKNKPSKDTNKINVINWNPMEIKLRHDEPSASYEYFWEIPELYKKKVTQKNNKFYSKKTPQVVYDAIYEKKMVSFNPKNFIHLKLSTPSSLKTDGKSIPPCIYLFDSFFMLKVLERYNEVICFEDINPFRVIAMDPGTNPGNPILGNSNSGVWAAAVDNMISEHRRDPGSYHKFPFPINYQQLSGDGKNLAPVELMQQQRNNILNALNIPQELYTMSLQAQAVGPALRLFENSWSCVVDNYNKLLQHWGDVIGKIRGLTPARFSLMPITFADDMERKSVIGQLVSSNSIARSEFLKLYNFDYKDQLRKKMQEDLDAQELQEEEAERQQLKSMNKADIFGQQQQGQQGGAQMGGQAGAGNPGGQGAGDNVGSGAGMSPQDLLQQAQEIAQKLQGEDGAARRTELQKIKAQNETLWASVKAQLQQMDSGAKSQGLKDSKQQGQQPGGQGQ